MVNGLESAKFKLGRASDLIEAVRSAVLDYTEREPSSVTREPDGGYTLNFHEQPSPIISVLAGETIYQIRSALDHLAFELVQRNQLRSALPKGWEERCSFPLWCKRPKQPAYNCFEGTLPGITCEAFDFIESFQPYRGGEGNILRMLAELCNIDKHRHLNLTEPQAQRRDEAVVRYKGQVYNCSNGTRVRNGETTGSPYISDGDTQVLERPVVGAFHPFVSFHESSLGPGAADLPVDHVLDLCLNVVVNTIVPEFAKFL